MRFLQYSFRHLAASLCLAVLGLGAASGSEGGPTPIDPPRALGDFTFTDHTGAAFSSSDLRGTPSVLFFGFTHCPDVCPITLARLAAARRALSGADQARVRVVFVTVDPMRDTPARMAEFLAPFGPGITGLTAPLGTLAPLLRELGVAYAFTAATDSSHAHAAHGHGAPAYTVTHSEAIYLLDARARLAGVWTRPGDGASLTRTLGALSRGAALSSPTADRRPAGPPDAH